MRLLLDSTVLIDALRQKPAVERLKAHRRGGDTVYTTVINVEEVVRGLKPKEVDGARRLFNGLVLIPLGQSEGWQAGTWRREFGRKGITLTQSDCLVAAAAASRSARLITGNPGDFPMKEIEIEHWPVGE